MTETEVEAPETYVLPLDSATTYAALTFSINTDDNGEITVESNNDMTVALSPEMSEWFAENISHPYELLIGGHDVEPTLDKEMFLVRFSDHQDAILFKLRWS